MIRSPVIGCVRNIVGIEPFDSDFPKCSVTKLVPILDDSVFVDRIFEAPERSRTTDQGEERLSQFGVALRRTESLHEIIIIDIKFARQYQKIIRETFGLIQ